METPTPTRPATLKDIARVAGVHFSTVSLALGGSGKVSAVTRARVLQVVEQLGYRRDPVNFALAARRKRTRTPQQKPLIAFLTNRPSHADFNAWPHMPAFLEGAKAQANALGFRCELFLVADPPDGTPDLPAQLAELGAQGVILGAFLPHFQSLELNWSRYAVVKIDSSYMTPDVARVGHDHQQVVRLACQRLHALGYRRVGLAVGQYDEESVDELYSSSYILAQHLLNAPVAPPLYFGYRDGPETMFARLGEWVREHRLDAVMSNWFSIRSILEKADCQVPAQVACVCLCLNEPSAEVAGTELPHAMVGRQAVEMIALLIKTRQFGVPADPPCVYVAGKWHDGASAPARV